MTRGRSIERMADLGSPSILSRSLLSDAMSCSMCKRQIINAGIDRVVIRQSPTEYRTIPVSDWVENDDSIFQL